MGCISPQFVAFFSSHKCVPYHPHAVNFGLNGSDPNILQIFAGAHNTIQSSNARGHFFASKVDIFKTVEKYVMMVTFTGARRISQHL